CPLGGLAVGQRADFLVLDAQSPALLGMPPENLLDAAVFSSPGAAFRQVRVAGRLAPGRSAQIDADYVAAMTELWSA
ncbi:MAG TPA: formimidoylglutamate deiminase, partial [Ramlibacter sp.]